MRDPFALELRSSADGVELRYPLSAALYVVITAAVLLGLMYPVVGMSPGLGVIWRVLVQLTVVGAAYQVVWLMWLSTVRFDFARNQVRRGPVPIGKASDIEFVEPSPHARAALQVVFSDGHRTVRRWRIPGVREQQAALLGLQLAEQLHVPFRRPPLPGS